MSQTVKLKITKWGNPSPEVATLVAEYVRRIGGYLPLTTEVLKEKQRPDPKADRSLWIALDERGKQLSSIAFAGQLKRWQEDPGISGIRFFVGGPYGLAPEIRESCPQKLSLSASTLPSDLAYLLLAEQTYRALSILAGSPYHHA